MRKYQLHVEIDENGIKLQRYTYSQHLETIAMIIEDMLNSKDAMVTLTTEPIN